MFTNRRSSASEVDPSRPSLEVQDADGTTLARLAGNWTTTTVSSVDSKVRELESGGGGSLEIDLGNVSRIDTAGAWIVHRLVEARKAGGAEVALRNMSGEAETLLQALADTLRDGREPPGARRGSLILAGLESIGQGVHRVYLDARLAMHILGATIRGAQMKLGRGHAVNPAAIVSQIDRMGIGAIPVVVLMSAIVGAIVAQQGAFQLRYFGAEIFVVDLIGILVLRELGVLLTAIMIAGRSGSAITAEIGSMKMREEVDALTVIGLNPVGVLVFPRLVALVIALPCLTVLANFAALGGAMAVAWTYSGISPEAFVDRLGESLAFTTFFAGLIKAPFMALIIGIIASVEGMKVQGSAESLGRRVTASVVKAIFIVIVVDGLFAMFYAAVDF